MDIIEIQTLKNELQDVNNKITSYNSKREILMDEVTAICKEYNLDSNNPIEQLEALIKQEEDQLNATIQEAKDYIAMAKEELAKVNG